MPSTTNQETIRTKMFEIWQEPSGIIRLDPFSDQNTSLGIDEIDRCFKIFMEFTKGEKACVIFDIRDYSGFRSDKHTRSYAAGEAGVNTFEALALLLGSPASRVVGNLYLRISKPKYPVRLFTSESEAQSWLMQYLENQS